MTKVITFHLGDYRVIDNTLGVKIDLGRGVHITVHTGAVQTTAKIGDLVPLFTELPIGNQSRS